MTQTEQVAYTGTGPQTEAEVGQDVLVIGTWPDANRWSFKFPGCKK